MERSFKAASAAMYFALFAATPTKDEIPDWHIITAAGEFVGSPVEAGALAKTGKVRDAAKVKAALGAK